ncbi:NAD(P)H-hydrate dehydratase [Kurthia sibirica]|uniref:Bifunctional NAD(P)H-hydrate repair enzyme n=1 Tax=Kurthia sibirica TaxID=202750 RepID=A0A2U3AIZ7_9BACL|nr:NAD(P)H-hydrate dehydratase [Kurthia sibirica]PWI24508.1 hypothetical protein DEX24_13020 [Kurthia sibirica]GEK33572.1 bifunctional NAD(P)H-hydrate repair enzyme Nnr [Kurthia sibirica]
MYICTAQQMRELDAYTIEYGGLNELLLMEIAGNAVSHALIHNDLTRDAIITIVCGAGNNGGDGFVIARRLKEMGYNCSLFLAYEPQHLKGVAAQHFTIYNKNFPNDWQLCDQQLTRLKQQLGESTYIIDCLLGTGLEGELRLYEETLIQCINDATAYKIAVDLPSGLHATNGRIPTIAVHAKKTYTLAAPKTGFFLQQGPAVIGEWHCLNISVKIAAHAKLGMDLPQVIDDKLVSSGIPYRPADGHKGVFGYSWIIAGSSKYIGAAVFCSNAAFQTGCGIVELTTTSAIHIAIASQSPDILLTSYDEALEIPNKANVIAFGPGLGREKPTLHQAILQKITALNHPLIIDADGLYYATNMQEQLKKRSAPTILTPHPGEMAMLLKRSIDEVENNRFGVAKELAKRYDAFVLYKGHRTIITAPNGQQWLCPIGDDALGRGGTGDVLTGLLTSLLAQGSQPMAAMQVAVYIHAAAASEVGKRTGNYKMTAWQLIDALAIKLGQYIR